MDDYVWMPCMHCMMMDMYEQPMVDMEEEHLKMMYPRIYVRIMPLVKLHCDKYEEVHGTMSCPRHEHIEDMCDKIYKKIQRDFDEEYRDDDNDDMLVRQPRRRHFGKDLINILLLNEVIKRRRRRRRRRRPRPRPY